jgi:glycine cleavage system H protein
MNIPEDLKYTASHEWVRAEGDLVRMGITDHAQAELQDITYIELPEVGDEFGQGKPFGIIESVKAAVDLNLPVGGEVVEVNAALAEELDTISNDPYGDGWMLVLQPSDPAELKALMDAAAYARHVEEEG